MLCSTTSYSARRLVSAFGLSTSSASASGLSHVGLTGDIVGNLDLAHDLADETAGDLTGDSAESEESWLESYTLSMYTCHKRSNL